MSIQQMSEVFDDTTLKGNEKLLMLALADNSNDSGVSFPSWEKLLHKTSMSKGALSKWLKVLEDKNKLFRVARTRQNGSKTSNKFIIYPHKNKEILDEKDYLEFKHLYDQSSEVELGGKVQKLNYQSSEVELPNWGQSSEVELLEPSLKNLTITLTITNKRLKKEIESKLQESKSINLDAVVEWINYKNYKNIAPITKTINFLSKFDFATQQKIVDSSIMNGYQGLFEPKQQQQPYNTPKSQTLNTDVNVWDMIEEQSQREQGAING